MTDGVGPAEIACQSDKGVPGVASASTDREPIDAAASRARKPSQTVVPGSPVDVDL